MERLRTIYHRAVPERIRNPIGMARRRLVDRITRVTTRDPLPPPELLGNVQMTPFVAEYLRVGRRSAESIARMLDIEGLPPGASVLDFGCGSGRTLRHLGGRGWELHGCDVDREAIAWCREHLARMSIEISSAAPPLPYDDDAFDATYAVSVFTHFDREEQLVWAAELARVVRPGAIAVISTMGPSVIENFPRLATPAARAALANGGFAFIPGESTFNSHSAFHSVEGVRTLFAPHFELISWSEHGLDGFQDLSVLRRTSR